VIGGKVMAKYGQKDKTRTLLPSRSHGIARR
jgi:hypothetical protein